MTLSMKPHASTQIVTGLVFAWILSLAAPALAQEPDPADWPAVLAEAEGQTVYWHAWGGDTRINDFIAWAGDRLSEDHGVTLEHVKLSDTADAVSRVIAEKAAGQVDGGAVDAIWINGENFIALKDQDLLFGPFAESLPNYGAVNTANDVIVTDFQEPVEGMESPWLLGQFVLYYDADMVLAPPRTPAAWLAHAEENPGRLTYPQPPDFTAGTFLKQMLISLEGETEPFLSPLDGPEDAARLDALFTYLDALHPHLWRGGRAFPAGAPALRALLSDGEIDVAFSNNPSEAAGAIATGELPGSTIAYTFDGGTIGNASFIAIPFNASAKAGAMVLSDFLLSPEAQARMQDPAVWGAPSVLDIASLDGAAAEAFAGADAVPGFPAPAELAVTIPEPHGSWLEAIETEWQRRYGG